MTKVWVEGNYLFILQDGIEYEGLAKDVLVRRLTDADGEKFYFTNVNEWDRRKYVELADLVDIADVPFTDATWRAFYTENTGEPIVDSGAAILDEVIKQTDNNEPLQENLIAASKVYTGINWLSRTVHDGSAHETVNASPI